MSYLTLDQGYKVYALDLNIGDGVKALQGATPGQLDVTSMESINKFKASLGDEPIDLLLNIAGACSDTMIYHSS